MAEVSNANSEKIKYSQDHRLIIGYSGSPSSADFWGKLKQAMFSRAKDLGVVVVDFSSNDFSSKTQQAGLFRAVELNVDGMIIAPNSDDLSDAIEIFKNNNIPVVAVDSTISNDWVATTVATDNRKAAEIAGRFILDHLQKKNNNANRVIILSGDKGKENARIRASVPLQILSDAGYAVHVYYSKGWSSKLFLTHAMAEFSSNGLNIGAVFACSAKASIASVEGAEAYGLRPVQVGFDMDENMRMMIETDRLDGTVVQNPEQMGAVSIESMVRILKGETLPKFIDIPARLVTPHNVKNF